MSEAWYMTDISNIYLGMGGMLTTILVGTMYLIIFQAPVENLIEKYIRSNLRINKKEQIDK